jgi:hypothetical protein
MTRPTALLLLFLCACSSRPPAESAPAPGATSTRLDPTATGRPAREPGAPLRFQAQEGWIEEPAAGAMRKAQYRLPRAAGDSEAGTLEANLERWAGQFEQPDGGSSLERMRRMQRKVVGMDVTEVDLSGTYVAETAPGSGERVNEPGWRLLAAVIESDHGPYYAKLVGPQATIARWEASFQRFVGEVR